MVQRIGPQHLSNHLSYQKFIHLVECKDCRNPTYNVFFVNAHDRSNTYEINLSISVSSTTINFSYRKVACMFI